MPSDVKSLIKQARNLIAINDHKKAIETCQVGFSTMNIKFS